jgi:hypothetical protein
MEYFVCFIRNNQLGSLFRRGSLAEAVDKGTEMVQSQSDSSTEQIIKEQLETCLIFDGGEWSVCIGIAE